MPVDVDYQRIMKADPAEWLTYSGNYRGYRYSTLAQVNRNNVRRLRPVWIHQVPSMERLQTSPLVADGVMYISEPLSNITALDIRTGRVLWTFRRSVPGLTLRACCGLVNRGLAIMGELLFMGTIDAHLIAVDTRTGRLRWDIEVANHQLGYAITSAPLAVKDKVVIGISGGEFGVRGFLDAYYATSGKRAWRFWTVPGPGEPGHETWAGDSWKSGAAPTWLTGSFDPELNLLYWGTGNPGPVLNGDQRLGDNLFSNSLLALDPDTGERRWHFQFTPHDVHDWDATQVPVLIDKTIDGKPRKLVVMANRNAFFYVLDRQSGEFLRGAAFAKQTWAKGLDSKGRPIPEPNTNPTKEGVKLFPGALGGTNWWSPSYSPQAGLFFVAARDDSVFYLALESPYRTGRLFLSGTYRAVLDEKGRGAVRALRPETGEKVWEFPLHSPPFAGLLSTGGGLVFGGTPEGNFFALDAATGKALWQFDTGGEIIANPISYMSYGRQYVAIAAGHAILAFAVEE